jgi:hypothetical protein
MIHLFDFSIDDWSWVPIVGPHLGGLIGVLIYSLFIEAHWPEDRLPVLSGIYI